MWLDETGIINNDDDDDDVGFSSQGSAAMSRSKTTGESKLSLRKKRKKKTTTTTTTTTTKTPSISFRRRKRLRQKIEPNPSLLEEQPMENDDNHNNRMSSSCCSKESTSESRTTGNFQTAMMAMDNNIPIPPFTPLDEDDDDDDPNTTTRHTEIAHENDVLPCIEKQDVKQNLERKVMTDEKKLKQSQNTYPNDKTETTANSNHNNPILLTSSNSQNDVTQKTFKSIPSFSPYAASPMMVKIKKSEKEQIKKRNLDNQMMMMMNDDDLYPPKKRLESVTDLTTRELDVNHQNTSKYFQSKSKSKPIHKVTTSQLKNNLENNIGLALNKPNTTKITKDMVDVSDSDDDWLVPSPAFKKKSKEMRKESALQFHLKKNEKANNKKTEPDCVIIDIDDCMDPKDDEKMTKTIQNQPTAVIKPAPLISTATEMKYDSKNDSITCKVNDNDNKCVEIENEDFNKMQEKSISSDKKQNILELSDDENFDISRAQRLSEKEKHLNQSHSRLLNMSKRGSEDKSRKEEKIKAEKKSNGRQSRKKLCVICSTCSCSKISTLQEIEQSTIKESKNPLHLLARSGGEIERALIGRLSRLEKSAAWFDHLCFKVSRELKKHRSKTMKMALDDNANKEKHFFLEDAVIGDDFVMKHGIDPPISSSSVRRAKRKVFSFRKKRQPTLTQMMGKDDKSEDEMKDENELGEEEIDVNSNCDVDCAVMEEKNVFEGTDDPMDDSHDFVELCIDEDISENHVMEEESFENQMAEFYDARYRKENRVEELALHTQSGNILWDFSKSSKISNISHIGVAELPSNSEKSRNIYLHKPSSSENHDKKSLSKDNDQEINNQIFNCFESDNNTDGVSHLLELFGDTEINLDSATAADANDVSSIVSYSKDSDDIPNFSQLSQQGKVSAQEIERDIMTDPTKRLLIQKICPNWKENVSFALLQKNSFEIDNALDNLKKERERMDSIMEKIKSAFDQRNLVLNLYQEALEKSLKRSTTRDDMDVLIELDGSKREVSTDRNSKIKLNESSSQTEMTGRNKKEADLTIERKLFTIDESDSESSLMSYSWKDSSKKKNHDVSDSHSVNIQQVQNKKCTNVINPDEIEHLNLDLPSLETNELKSLMEKYGLKAQSRGRMIHLLTEVFDTIRKDSFDMNDANVPLSQNSFQSKDDVSVASICSKTGNRKVQDIQELHKQCKDAIDRDPSLKLRILSHESVEFTEVRQTILKSGIKISKKGLSRWLDENKIRYADPWRQRK